MSTDREPPVARRAPARWRWTPPNMRVRRALYRGESKLADAWETVDHQWFWRTAANSGLERVRRDAERAAKYAVEHAEIQAGIDDLVSRTEAGS